MVISTGAVAHCPAVGVKVYFVVVVLFIEGAQEPITPLIEVVGKGAKASPEQMSFTGRKVASVGLMVINIFIVVAHCSASGVKV